MIRSTPRLRMFAGPNGSGKSTIKSLLKPELLGIYINPDELQKAIQTRGHVALGEFGISSVANLQPFLKDSPLVKQAGLLPAVHGLQTAGCDIIFPGSYGDEAAYLASAMADFIRCELLALGATFTFETVMSSESKLDILNAATLKGYRTYLYFIATEDPSINISRVKNRVALGGHDVPQDKIITRYERSLKLLLPAMKLVNRAYIFDNSGQALVWIAEGTNGSELEIRSEYVPAWFKRAVLDRLYES